MMVCTQGYKLQSALYLKSQLRQGQIIPSNLYMWQSHCMNGVFIYWI